MKHAFHAMLLGAVISGVSFVAAAAQTQPVPATAPKTLGAIPSEKTPPPTSAPYKPVKLDRESLDWYGPYLFVGRDVDVEAIKKENPFIRGAFVNYRWSDIEPRRGEFNWELFDSRMTAPAKLGLYIQFIVNVGPDSPEWIYDHGVPVVETTPTTNPRGQAHWTKFPYYLDEDYQTFYYNMLTQVAAHIETLPADVRQHIIGVVTAEGTTGDEGPYKGEVLDAKYHLDVLHPKWLEFKFKTFKFFESLYAPKNPPIHITINSGNSGQYHEWLMENMPDTWRKAGNPGHGYQLNDEMSMVAFLDPIINQPNENGRIIRARSEMDETHKGWFKQNPVWNQYWLNVWLAHFGMDIEQYFAVGFAPEHAEGYIFYGKYAGQKDPAASPGAFCALRDGLDAMDYERFPRDQFGDAEYDPSAANQDAQSRRALKIAEAFAKFGAKQEDPDKGNRQTMLNRSAEKMNDVGWNIWDNNYQRYLTQIDPNDTSIGWWRVGSENQPYGRFARGFESASGKKAMYFDLNEHFYEGQSAKTHAVELRVVYLDRGKGNWSLRYDAEGDPQKAAFEVENTDSGRWLEKKVTLSDAVLGNHGTRNSDLELRHEGGQDTIFHMVELTRAE